MSNWYVRSGATGTANGADWTDAYLTINNAISATNTAAGDILWVSDDHHEVTATAIGWTATASPVYIICANHTSGNIPPNINTDLQTSANVATNTGIFFGSSNMVMYGINLNLIGTAGAQTFGLTGASILKFDNCTFNFGTLSSLMNLGGPTISSKSIFNNSTFILGSASQVCRGQGGYGYFNNVVFTSSNLILPTNFFNSLAGQTDTTKYNFKRCDFSAIGSGKTIFNKITPTAADFTVKMEDCIVNNSVSIVSPTANGGLGFGTEVVALRTTSNSSYSEYYADGWGIMQDSNTTFRVGGATDGFSVHSKSIQTFNVTPSIPFSPMSNLTKFNSNIGQPIKAIVYGTWNQVTLPNNSVIWLDVEYFGNASSNRGNLVSSGQGSLANSSIFLPNQTTTLASVDSSTWVNGGSNNFSISVTFTPQQVGPVRGYLNFGLSNMTLGSMFIDPVLYLTDISNNPISTTQLSYNVIGGTINESGSIGINGIIIQGL